LIAIRRPTSRQNSNVASFSVSISGRQPNRAFQRIGSKTNDDRTYRKSSFEISNRPWRHGEGPEERQLERSRRVPGELEAGVEVDDPAVVGDRIEPPDLAEIP
jgi:hypothetical protein